MDSSTWSVVGSREELRELVGVPAQRAADKVRDRLNPKLEVAGILATMHDSRTLHGRQVLERVVEAFPQHVFHTVISRTVRFPETTAAGEPITSYAQNSTGANAYRALAREMISRWPGR